MVTLVLYILTYAYKYKLVILFLILYHTDVYFQILIYAYKYKIVMLIFLITSHRKLTTFNIVISIMLYSSVCPNN